MNKREGSGLRSHRVNKRDRLKNPNVSTVITGASRPEQVSENMKALEVAPKLDSDVLEQVEVILGNKPQPSHE